MANLAAAPDAAELARLRAEVRRLQVLVAVADDTAAEGVRLGELLHLIPDGEASRVATFWAAAAYKQLGHRLAAARKWIAGQGPDGPMAAYPLDSLTLRRGPALPPELHEEKRRRKALEEATPDAA